MNVALHNDYRCQKLDGLLTGVILPAPLAVTDICAVTADSRTVRPGSLFFAVPGLVHDGHAFIDDAVRAGAVAIVCQDSHATSEASLSWRGDVPVVGVKDVFATLGQAAAHFYGDPSHSVSITGVTGTNGKSTCVFLLAQLQQLLGENAAVIGTLGYGPVNGNLLSTGMTTPDVISCHHILRELVDRQTTTVAMEVSSHGLVQNRVAGVEITTAVFTNLTRDHLDYHGDMTRYAQAKAQLFALPGLRHAVVNIDDPNANAMIAALHPGTQLWTYSLHDLSAEIFASRTVFHADGMTATVRTPWGSGEIRTGLLGEFNLYNLLAVVTAACAQGADFHAVLHRLPELQPVKGRMQKISATSDVQVVVDYAHTPDALRQALAALRLHGERKIHVVFGCGGDRDTGKRPQMAAVAEVGADHVIVTSDNPRTEAPEKIIVDICRGFRRLEKVQVIEDRARAIAAAIESAEAGDMVLIAGKGHEDYQILGARRLPFDDAAQARLALQARQSGEPR